MLLHERLRQLRHERGWRLKDLSERTMFSVPYLSDLERGRATPSLETLRTIAQAYRLSVLQLLDGTELYGQHRPGSGLPSSLQELLADPVLNHGITPDWVNTLTRIELRGKRPKTKSEWYEIFIKLRRIIK